MSRILNTIYDLTRFKIGCQPLTNRSKSIISTTYLEIEDYRWKGIISKVIGKLKLAGTSDAGKLGGHLQNNYGGLWINSKWLFRMKLDVLFKILMWKWRFNWNINERYCFVHKSSKLQILFIFTVIKVMLVLKMTLQLFHLFTIDWILVNNLRFCRNTKFLFFQ